jgi:hypothetical protein
MNKKCLLATILSLIVFAAMPVFAQFPPQGDDATSSLGSFKVFIASKFVGLFNNPPPNSCPLYDPNSNILSSPSQLFDPGTVIGRSNPITDGSPPDLNGLPVGSADTIVSENMLIPPPGFPCSGLTGCSSGTGTREVHTEVRSLHMTGSGAAVRAGIWYNSPKGASTPPAHISPGEVESQSGPSNDPTKDFPASSYFDIFVQVDVPACGLFPGATLYNLMPLVVKNNQVNQFPPKVVYLHDSSSIVPILFLNNDTANPPRWQKDDILGYFVLVGHGVGFGTGDLNQFNTIMQGQSNATCPISPPAPAPSPSPTSTSGAAAVPANTAPARPTPAPRSKPNPGGGHK